MICIFCRCLLFCEKADALLVFSFSATVATDVTELIPRANLIFSFKLLVNSVNARCSLCITAQTTSRNGTLVILLHQEVSTEGNAFRQSATVKYDAFRICDNLSCTNGGRLEKKIGCSCCAPFVVPKDANFLN